MCDWCTESKAAASLFSALLCTLDIYVTPLLILKAVLTQGQQQRTQNLFSQLSKLLTARAESYTLHYVGEEELTGEAIPNPKAAKQKLMAFCNRLTRNSQSWIYSKQIAYFQGVYWNILGFLCALAPSCAYKGNVFAYLCSQTPGRLCIRIQAMGLACNF